MYAEPAISQVGFPVADDSDAALLDRLGSGLRRLLGTEPASPAPPAQEFDGDVQAEPHRPSGHAAWLRQQSDGDPAMRRDYLQAAAAHPHLFREDDALLTGHVETVVRHFAQDGLTRRDYFQALATDPRLLLQKPATVIGNLEAVMDHYAADAAMRRDYLQAAVAQPVLFRAPPERIFATIEATADRLEAQGITRSDLLRRAVDPPRSFTQEPEAIRAPAVLETGPAPPDAPQAMPTALPAGQAAASSPLPSTRVVNPVLYVSYVPAQGRAR